MDAIAQHRDAGFYFNEGTIDVATVDGQSGYGEADVGYPDGLIEVIGELRLELEQDAENLIVLQRLAWPVFQEYRVRNATKAQPLVWSFWNQKIELSPTPDATVHNLVGEGYVEVGTILKAYVGGVWKFYKPGTTTDLTDGYPSGADVNKWFTEPGAYQMILNYAEYLLYGGKIHAQDMRGEAALQRYLECRTALEQRGNRLSTPREIQPIALDW